MPNETELDQGGNVQSNQTATNGSEQTKTDSQKLYEVNGQKLTADQLAESYKNLQGKMTQVTQKMAQYEPKDVESNHGNDADVEVAKKALKDLGFVHQDDLMAKEQQQAQDRKLDSLIASNPSLEGYKDAIRAIAKTDNSAYEDIVVKYGFAAKDKLAQAKNGDVIGEPISKYKKEAKAVKDLSNEEYEVWRKENLKRGA